MASTGSATADNTATSQNSSEISTTSNRIPITGASMAVAYAVTELAEVVEATIKKKVSID
jgi:hypothetical protein